MARTLNEAPLTTRNARSKLPAGLHWRGIDAEVHLGYRKGKRGGMWLVRWPGGKKYQQATIGAADDKLSEGTLDFEAAVRAARETVERCRKEAKAASEGPVLTVRAAVEAYIETRNARDSRRAGRPVNSDANGRLRKYVIGRDVSGKRRAVTPSPLAGIPLHRLSEADFAVWRAGLPAELKSTARQRLFNDLKAGLNACYAMHRKRLPPDLPETIKVGLKSEEIDSADDVARENQILRDADISRLILAARQIDAEQGWDGDLFRLVLVMAATGARFSQIARMRVGDVQIAESRLLVPPSRKGKGNKAGQIVFGVGRDVIEALVPAVTGRASGEPLLERWRHKQAPGGIAWERDTRGPWLASGELVRPWHAIRERAKLPGVIPYALRHSSIVKHIRANLPIRLVAALHDTSTAMIERHYAKWITSGLEEMQRAAIVPLVPPTGGADVVQFAAAGA